MQKAHRIINWENYPSTNTALNAQNLNSEDRAIDTIDDRVIALDLQKANQTDLLNTVKSTTLNMANGVMTITYWNGTVVTYQTGLAGIAINFDYDPVTQRLIIKLQDGTYKYVDMSALITQYEFDDSETIVFQVETNGHVTASVRPNSIKAEHLEENYLGDITAQADKAEIARANAERAKEETSELVQIAKGAEEQIRKMTRLSEFFLDDDGNLIYTNDSSYRFEVDDDGDLTWEVVE